MKILPASLRPWQTRIDRRHTPPPARGPDGYRRYRQCLRWEFGFTCPFCLCHEADLALEGAEGTGITQVEHWIPASYDESMINDYTNCLYICRYCNNSRGARPIDEARGPGRLVNPCADVWERLFALDGDQIKPRSGSADALYTLAVYDLNDPRKVKRRRRRRTSIKKRLDFIEQAHSLSENLLEKSMDVSDPELVDVARFLEDQIQLAWQDLADFQAVPPDAQCPCACGDEDLCSLPPALEEQLVELDAPFVPGWGRKETEDPKLHSPG